MKRIPSESTLIRRYAAWMIYYLYADLTNGKQPRLIQYSADYFFWFRIKEITHTNKIFISNMLMRFRLDMKPEIDNVLKGK